MDVSMELERLPKGPDGYVDWTRVRAEDIELPEDFNPNDGDDDVREEEMQIDSSFKNVIFCDHLPVVPPEKFDKLLSVLKRIFSQIGTIKEGGLWMPVDEETKMSKGFAFVEYNSPEEATAAMEQTDGYKLDRQHVFKVNRLEDLDKYGAVPDEYAQPEEKEFMPRENLHSWLLDERGRDQFVIRYADETEVYWNDAHQSRPEEVYRRQFWTESYVQWSPRGHYLATVHRQGAALWGGPGWQRLQRLSHPGIQFLEFSPGERFLATCSVREPTNAREHTAITVNVFDVRSGRLMATFQGGMDDFLLPGAAASAGARGGFTWPVFKWAGGGEDRFFAKIGKNAIHVYETPSMELLDKKSFKLEGVVDFLWSPADAILAVYQPEQGGGNQPARISLWAMPQREEIRQKNLFSVSEVRMFWHPQGEYLCVKVDRFTKTKKTTFTGFELFRVKEKECPMEVLELENKNEKIIAFAWEPNGHRFCCIHGDGPRPDVSFYSMRDGANYKVKHLVTLKGKTANAIYWSPAGRNIVLAGLKAMNGQLEFFNADEMETLATAEHFMCTDVDWDPTGRYLASSVTSVHQMENGFNVWSFNGKLLYRLPRDRFFQFLWRPRPPSLLSAEQEREILANLKKYSARYAEIDEGLSAAADSEQVSKRNALVAEWRAWLEEKRQAFAAPAYQEQLARLVGARKQPDSSRDEEIEVEVEEEISKHEEVLSFTGR